jgi:hypothetical protein
VRIIADTNVLVRAMTGDDAVQSEIAQAELANADMVALALPALCELVWVLSRGYRIPTPDRRSDPAPDRFGQCPRYSDAWNGRRQDGGGKSWRSRGPKNLKVGLVASSRVAGQEQSDLLVVARQRRVIFHQGVALARQGDEARARDAGGDLPPHFEGHARIVANVHH